MYFFFRSLIRQLSQRHLDDSQVNPSQTHIQKNNLFDGHPQTIIYSSEINVLIDLSTYRFVLNKHLVQ